MYKNSESNCLTCDMASQVLLLLLLLLLLSHFSRVWLCATPKTAAHQAPPSLGFSRQEHWSGLLVVNNPLANAGEVRDTGSIPGSGTSPGEGNGNPFQYSCQENPMDRGALWATVLGITKSQTQPKWLSTHTCYPLAVAHQIPAPFERVVMNRSHLLNCKMKELQTCTLFMFWDVSLPCTSLKIIKKGSVPGCCSIT